MAAIKDIVVYILANYPHPTELSNARVTKMVYLADWRHAITHGRQISPIRWKFNDYGPFVWDVKHAIENDPETFAASPEVNYFGTPKLLFSLKDRDYQPQLQQTEREAIDHVIETTKPMTWGSFLQLVYSTFPVVNSERYSTLDLVELARQYIQSISTTSSSIVQT